MHQDDHVAHLILHLLVVALNKIKYSTKCKTVDQQLTASPCPRYMVLITASSTLTSNVV